MRERHRDRQRDSGQVLASEYTRRHRATMRSTRGPDSSIESGAFPIAFTHPVAQPLAHLGTVSSASFGGGVLDSASVSRGPSPKCRRPSGNPRHCAQAVAEVGRTAGARLTLPPEVRGIVPNDTSRTLTHGLPTPDGDGRPDVIDDGLVVELYAPAARLPTITSWFCVSRVELRPACESSNTV